MNIMFKFSSCIVLYAVELSKVYLADALSLTSEIEKAYFLYL